jgi:magnesium chelatase family protein
VPFAQLSEMPPGPTSPDQRAQVLVARARQATRFGPRAPLLNGRMTPRQVRKFRTLKPETMSLLKAAMEDLGLLGRAHDEVLRIASRFQLPRSRQTPRGSRRWFGRNLALYSSEWQPWA